MDTKRLISWVVLPAFCAFAGCASKTGVIQAGAGTFMVAKEAPTTIDGVETMKADATADAAQFCTGKGKSLQVLSATEQPASLRSRSRIEVQFRCL
jgi:hypothetical protein